MHVKIVWVGMAMHIKIEVEVEVGRQRRLGRVKRGEIEDTRGL